MARTDLRRAESISAIHNAFGAIEPPRESAIDSFLPNDTDRFSDIAPGAARPERHRLGQDGWTFHFSATSPFMKCPDWHNVIAF